MTASGTEEARRRVDGGPEEYKATGALAIDGPVLVEDLHAGGNRVRRTEPAWMVLEVVHWGRHHRVKDLPWLVRGQLFNGFGILFHRGLFNHSFCV